MSTNGQLPVEERQLVLQRMIREWGQQAFAATVNAKVAERLQDDGMRKQAVGQLRRAEGALVVLKEELIELGVEVGVGSE